MGDKSHTIVEGDDDAPDFLADAEDELTEDEEREISIRDNQRRREESVDPEDEVVEEVELEPEPEQEKEDPTEDPVDAAPPDYDPVLDQANKLPSYIWGSEGDAGQHVRPAGDGGDDMVGAEFFDEDEPLGAGIGDPSKLTA